MRTSRDAPGGGRPPARPGGGWTAAAQPGGGRAPAPAGGERPPPPPARPHRIVVVGHGMVAARFLDDLSRAVPACLVEVTVLGEEPEPAYNRLLLAEVLAGSVALESLPLPEPPPGVTVHTGRTAVALDRRQRHVVDDRNQPHPYDTLVLATGAAARVPDLPGADDRPAAVHTLRSLADCRRILRAARGATHAVVLGGGLLGVEAARGLIARGIGVTVIHAGPHVLDRQLDALSADVARRAMADLGLAVVAGTTVTALVLDGVGQVRGVRLSDGRDLPADLVLVAAGVVPRTGLARRAGLGVGRGILVGDDLRSPDDPRIAAIGDCAEPPEGCPGLLAPGWEQAARLAASLAAELRAPRRAAELAPDRAAAPAPDIAAAPAPGGTAAATRPARSAGPAPAPASLPPAPLSPPTPNRPHTADVVRLKAEGLDIVTLGRLPDDDEARLISLVDRRGRRSLQVAIEDDRIVGAVLVGAGAVAADLTVAYQRGTPVPDDPALLLVGGAAMLAPAVDDDTATVCSCNRVSRGTIAEACRAGAHTVAEIAGATRATTGCGGCVGAVSSLLDKLAAAPPAALAVS